MEKLQTTTENQLANITIDIDLVKELYHVNYLTSFPIPDAMLEGWAKSLQELEPKITPQIVKKIIDKMKIGEIDFDGKKGVQNIFIGYLRLKYAKVSSNI